MTTDTTPPKERLRLLIDELPDGELHAAAQYLSYLRDHADPVLRTLLDAPEGDEAVSEEEESAVREAHEDLDRGRIRSLLEAKRELDS